VSDIPNFSAWSQDNLAQFSIAAYRKMQQQQETIEQLQGDFKDAMVELRKLTSASLVNNQR
jgi:membrane-anchored glycerophosphoryl diester phosphodiesterase (GDPDase)